MKGALASASMPIAYVIAGPLADRVFEPLMQVDGFLANSIGKIIGVGKGHGISLMFILFGFSLIMVTAAAYQYPRLRRVEDELPDAISDPIETAGRRVSDSPSPSLHSP